VVVRGVVLDRWESIAQVPVGGGPVEVLATLQPGDDHFIDDVQLATGLLDTAEVRDAGVDRGPWPTWLRLMTAAGVLAAAGLVLLAVRLFRRGRARPARRPSGREIRASLKL
jgi:hypothetical protein